MSFSLLGLLLLAGAVCADGPEVKGSIDRIDGDRGFFVLKVGKKLQPIYFTKTKFEIEGKVYTVELVKDARKKGMDRQILLLPATDLRVQDVANSERKQSTLRDYFIVGRPVTLFLGDDGKTLQTDLIKLR
jgi:hypothetical protein